MSSKIVLSGAVAVILGVMAICANALSSKQIGAKRSDVVLGYVEVRPVSP